MIQPAGRTPLKSYYIAAIFIRTDINSTQYLGNFPGAKNQPDLPAQICAHPNSRQIIRFAAIPQLRRYPQKQKGQAELSPACLYHSFTCDY